MEKGLKQVRARKENMPEAKKIVLDWKGSSRLEARNEKGVSVSFDASKEYGGEETALLPMETLLASLAACSSFDVLKILKKKRQKVTGYSVEATAERREDPPPKVFTKIHMKYTVKGKNIAPEAVERAIKLSEEKYCSVSAMLRNSVDITSSFEILEP